MRRDVRADVGRKRHERGSAVQKGFALMLIAV